MGVRPVLVTAICALEVGCIGGVLWLGARILPTDEASQVAAETRTVEPATPPDVQLEASGLSDVRVPLLAVPGPGSQGVGRVRRDRRTEKDFFEAFSRLGCEEIEAAARAAIAREGPECEKVAALRALWVAGSPAAFELLAIAAETLPDASGPQADSVPRFAVRVLLERAPQDARARQTLERVAWGGRGQVSPEIRRVAARGLAMVADEAEGWRMVSRLQIEQDDRVLADAAEALSRNAGAGSAAAAAARWVAAPPAEGGPAQEEEKE